MNRLTTLLGTTPAAGVTIHKTRRLTVNEVIGAGGPLEVLVNNTLYDGSKPRAPFTDPVTGQNDFTRDHLASGTPAYYSELPYEGETELWEIINLTADAHPMHPHLVGFQVLNRQALDVKGYLAAYNATYAAVGLPLDGYGPPFNYNNSGNSACSPTAPGPYRAGAPYAGPNPACVLGGNPDPAATLSLIGLPVPPAPQEVGWKDTVQALPGMVTRILVRFAADPNCPSTTLHLGCHGRVRFQPEPRPRLRLALPHRRPRGQRDDAAVLRDRERCVPPHLRHGSRLLGPRPTSSGKGGPPGRPSLFLHPAGAPQALL